MQNSQIRWIDNVPYSAVYDDIYFSKENGLAETDYIFLQGNKLPQRWADLTGDFHIIETGFGTGLNFFASCKLWQNYGGKKLHFTSIEKYPLPLADLCKAISNWPEFDSYIAEFSAQYSLENCRNSKITLDNGRINLNLLLGDVSEILPQLNVPADAWFLDGFAPAKNPDMWTDNLYKSMGLLTKNGGTCASFTAAGNVRRGLMEHGFQISKIKGFGNKRHMLVGVKGEIGD